MVVGGIFVLRLKPKKWQIAVLIVMMLPLIFFVPQSYKDRIMTVVDAIPGMGNAMRTDQAIKGRVSELTVGFRMFLDHPILGVGVGNYPAYYQQYSRELGMDPRLTDRSAHSLYLQIASETGLVGLAVFAFILWKLFKGIRRAKEDFLAAGNPALAGLATTFGIAMIGYLTAGIFLHTAFPKYLWLLIGIGLAIPQIAKNELEQSHNRSLKEAENVFSEGLYV